MFFHSLKEIKVEKNQKNGKRDMIIKKKKDKATEYVEELEESRKQIQLK